MRGPGASGRADGGSPSPVISTPLKPPPPNWIDDPFHSLGRFTWYRISGARGSTGLIAPMTLQYSGVAGMTAFSGGAGVKGGFGFIASGAGSTSVAESTRAPPLGRPIELASIGWVSAAHCCAAPDARVVAVPPAHAVSSALRTIHATQNVPRGRRRSTCVPLIRSSLVRLTPRYGPMLHASTSVDKARRRVAAVVSS